MGGGSGVDFTISVFLFCTFGDLPLILVGLSANPKKRTRFCIQRYLRTVTVEAQAAKELEDHRSTVLPIFSLKVRYLTCGTLFFCSQNYAERDC